MVEETALVADELVRWQRERRETIGDSRRFSDGSYTVSTQTTTITKAETMKTSLLHLQKMILEELKKRRKKELRRVL